MQRQPAEFTHAELTGLMHRWETDPAAIENRAILLNTDEREFQFQPIRSGLSGAAVYRVSVSAIANASILPLQMEPSQITPSPMQWALKASPAAVPVERMIRNATLIRLAAEDCDLLSPPQTARENGSTLVEAFGFYWELSRWCLGQPLAIDASSDSIRKGGEAIGRIHAALLNAGRDLPTPIDRVNASVPRCIRDRIARLQILSGSIERLRGDNRSRDYLAVALASQLAGEQPDEPASQDRCRQLADAVVQARGLLVRQWSRVVPRLHDQLVSIQQHPDALVTAWVLRDIHRGHLLFQGQAETRVVCALDYDALDCDSPAADLARWSGDFSWRRQERPFASENSEGLNAGDSRRAESPVDFGGPLAAAVAGYRQVCPFSDGQYQLAQILIDVNSVGGLANWLVWLTLEDRRFGGDASAIRGRITHLIASVCRIC